MTEKSVAFYGNLFEEEVYRASRKILDAGIEYIYVGDEGGPNVLWGEEKFGANSPKSIEDFIGKYLKEKKELEEAEKEAKMTLEEREARRKNAQAYLEGLYRQLDRVMDLRRGYLSYTGKEREQFLRTYIDPLTRALQEARNLPDFREVAKLGHMPILLVLPFSVVPFGAQGVRANKDFPDGRNRFDIGFRFEREILPRFMGEQREPGLYKNSNYSKPYVLLDVDYGRDMQGVVPRHAAEWLGRKNRVALTIEESIALVTHGEREKMGQFWVCGHSAQWTDGRQMVPFWHFDQKNGPNIAVMYFDDDTIPLGWQESGVASYSAAIGKDLVLPNRSGVEGVV